MGIMDAFSAEDRVQVKFSDFYALIKQAVTAELTMNAIDCDVPHRYIRETMTGISERNIKDEGDKDGTKIDNDRATQAHN